MQLLGHSEAENLLAASDKNRSQSFLLEGQKGIGKYMLAMKHAANVLGNMDKLVARSHPDFIVIERKYDEKADKRKKEIVVDDARELGGFLRLTPAESTHRVAIVDSADELNTGAANALLKLVEEPPKNSVIILLSHGGHVLPTIRSRCITVKLRSLADKEMRQILSQIIPNISDYDMSLLAQISEGSPGVAKEIYDNEGLWVIGELFEIFEMMPKTEYSKITKFAERINKSGSGWAIFCHIFEWLTANIAKSAAKGEALQLGSSRLMNNVNLPVLLDEISDWNQICTNTEIYNLDQKQVIVNKLLKISGAFFA